MTEERAAQAAFDLAFLAVLAGQQASEDVLVKRQLGKVGLSCNAQNISLRAATARLPV